MLSLRSNCDDIDEIDDLARQFLDELAEIGSVVVAYPASVDKVIDDGAKGAPIEVGDLLVKIVKAGGLTKVISTIFSWLSRDERRSISIKIDDNQIDVTGISKAEQTKLIEWFQLQTGEARSSKRQRHK